MTRQVFDKESFVKKANELFNSRFDYSKFEYVNAKTKSTIICPVHGEFLQNPDKHLQSKYGCMYCAKKKAAKNNKFPKRDISEAEYLKRLLDKYSDKFKFDLSEYESITKGKVKLICPIHGESEYLPRNLLQSEYGCKSCGMDHKNQTKTRPYMDFLEASNEVYNGFYTYPKDNELTYVNRKSMVTIECPMHGTFKKKAQKHLAGQGCFQCTIQHLVDTGKLVGGYSDRLFVEKPELKDKEAFVYYLKIGSVYKVGITTNLGGRLRNIKSESKHDVEVIETLETNLYAAYQIEQAILGDYDDYRTYRKWSTELFTKNVLSGKSLKQYR